MKRNETQRTMMNLENVMLKLETKKKFIPNDSMVSNSRKGKSNL